MDGRNFACMAAAGLVGSLLVLSAVSPAFGQPPVVVQGRAYYDSENQRVVRYGDLNLAEQIGQKSLLRRVGYAVNELCDTRQTRGSFKTIDRTCAGSAWESANPQITLAFDRARGGASIAAASLTIVAAH